MSRSKQDRKIFSVTGSTGLAELGWAELLRGRRSVAAMEEGIAESSLGDEWIPATIPEPIEPQVDR